MLRKQQELTDIEKLEILVPQMYDQRIGPYDDEKITHLIDLFKESEEANTLKTSVWGFEWLGPKSKHFTDMLNQFEPIVVSVSKPESKYFGDKKVWDFIISFIQMINSAIGLTIQHQSVPFGNNWYSFSITYPRILCAVNFYYFRTFKKTHSFLMDTLKRSIMLLIPTPRKSLGWTRNGSNAVMMLTPYLIAHQLMGTWQLVKNQPDVITTLKDLELKYVHSGIGIYYDGSFLFHDTIIPNSKNKTKGYLRAYGYLTSAYTEYVFLNRFFDKAGFNNAQICINKTLHPKIPLRFPSWFARTGSLKHNPQQFAGKLGLHVIDTIKGISLLHPNYVLQFNGQSSILSYTEIDTENIGYPLVSIFMRRMLFEGDEPYIDSLLVPYMPGVVTENFTKVEYKSQTANTNRVITTEQFFPQLVSCAVTKIGPVNGFNPENEGGGEICAAMINFFYLPKEHMFVKEASLVMFNKMYNFLNINMHTDADYVDVDTFVRSIGFGKKIIEIDKDKKIYLIDNREIVKVHVSGDVFIKNVSLDTLKKERYAYNSNSATDEANEYTLETDISLESANDDSQIDNIIQKTKDMETFEALACRFDASQSIIYSTQFYTGSVDIVSSEENSEDQEDEDENQSDDVVKQQQKKLKMYSDGYLNSAFTMSTNQFYLFVGNCSILYSHKWLSLYNGKCISFACVEHEVPQKFIRLPLAIYTIHKDFLNLNFSPFPAKVKVKDGYIDNQLKTFVSQVNYTKLYITLLPVAST